MFIFGDSTSINSVQGHVLCVIRFDVFGSEQPGGDNVEAGEEIPPSVCPGTVSLPSSCSEHNATRCPLQFIAA